MAKAWEQLEPWQRAEELEDAVGSIKLRGAQHHAEIDEVLCGRCEYGQVFRRRSGNGTLTVFCGRYDPGRYVPPDITECTQYKSNLTEAFSLEDMTKVAVLVDLRALPPSKNTYL